MQMDNSYTVVHFLACWINRQHMITSSQGARNPRRWFLESQVEVVVRDSGLFRHRLGETHFFARFGQASVHCFESKKMASQSMPFVQIMEPKGPNPCSAGSNPLVYSPSWMGFLDILEVPSKSQLDESQNTTKVCTRWSPIQIWIQWKTLDMTSWSH